MKIPSKFTINSQEIQVKIVETLSNQRFGEYNAITDVIQIATYVIDDDNNMIELKEEQMMNTFWHEMLHAFQWHARGETSEVESSTYAGYLIEFFKSSDIENEEL